jgi:putative transposase
MKRGRFTEEQIIGVLKEHQAGLSAGELCRKHGISDATFYIEPSRRDRFKPDCESARSLAAWRSVKPSG